MLAAGITPASAVFVLERVCRTDGASWGAALDEPDATAVLKLGWRAGLESWAEQEIIAGIAASHPRLVLNQLVDERTPDAQLPYELPGLSEALSDHADDLASWMFDRAKTPEVARAEQVVGLALAGGVSEHQARSIASLLDVVDAETLVAVLELLRFVEIWPLQQPSLARSFLQRADQLGHNITRHVLEAIEGATRLRGVSWTNGVSDEVNHALTLATRAAEAEPEPRLAAIYAHRIESLHHEVKNIEDRYARDTEF
ncbi:hypothetical protein NVV99_26125 [Rhodococcus sp. PAE-6]|uniref:hypothetical protein n=1 Tax=Rhodococcus sp. PAE-6 TaxID=2972477 RepID=UPI0021B31DB6|nr:hypothetical protein [Rhodococcus sp. PAE-6]MCT7294364.1 hypothetical protein [Rhodococcus sp. PAE-6]